MSSIQNGYVSTEPGLMVANAIVKPNKTGKFPVLIVNNTNKTLKLKKGCVIGKVTEGAEANLIDIKAQISKHKDKFVGDKTGLTGVSVPTEHRAIII